MDITNHLKYNGEALEINDMAGEITALPANFFADYTPIKYLSIYGTALTELPASISQLKNLQALKLYKTKIKALPTSVSELIELSALNINSNSFDLNKECKILSTLPKLENLVLNGYRGNTFPENISALTNLKRIVLERELKKKLKLSEVISVVSKLPLLEELEINIPIENEDITEEFLQLDRLTKFKGWFWPFLNKFGNAPLLLGQTKNMLFDRPDIDSPLLSFRQKLEEHNFSATQKQVLFGILIQNYSALNLLLPNYLEGAIKDKKAVNILLLDKPKGESAKSIKEKLKETSITVNNSGISNNIVVIGSKTTVDDAAPFVKNNDRMITIDHLKDVLVALADPWLLQTENHSVNTQLLQLLASNQAENYQLAFQIIEGGGANKTIQSLLAAIMLSHPDAVIYKAAEKLYDRYGSQSFKLHVKNTKLSLRISKDTERKVNTIVNQPDIDSFAFRLMHHCIAASNKNISDVQLKVLRLKQAKDVNISDALPYFTHFEELHFESCENLDIESAIPLFKQATGIKILNLNSCKITIPASIAQLTHLVGLDVGFNTIENPNALGSLKNLKQLSVEGTKLTEWSWLSSLTDLEHLNINNSALGQLPKEIYSIKTLIAIDAQQNKIKQIEEQFAELINLKSINLSNNQLSTFPYSICKLSNLNRLLLRSNLISEFDSDRVINEALSKSFGWTEFNLSRNRLNDFSLGEMQLPNIKILDISHNSITRLSDSIFQSNTLRELYAEHNQIGLIPSSILNVRNFTKLWLHKNAISRLENFMAKIVAENCDLSDNQISFIHPDFEIYGKDNHQRLYWKIRNNPISKNLNKFGGLYGH